MTMFKNKYGSRKKEKRDAMQRVFGYVSLIAIL